MAKVFRIHSTGGSQTDWFRSQDIGEAVIENIFVQDSRGSAQPTSIPTPFARIDLVRSAFRKLVTPTDGVNMELDGASDAHKLVSDALDVGQMFFNLSRHPELDVVRWNKEQSLQELKSSNDQKHWDLARTLELFLIQDADQYNFDRMEDVFILRYNHQVIGGTSPRTLFFASSRADNIRLNIHYANDEMLDNHLLPLYKRERNFVKYIYLLSRHTEGFERLFPEFYRYVEANIQILEREDFPFVQQIRALDARVFEGFPNLTMSGQDGIEVQVLRGISLKQAVDEPIQNSGFMIQSTHHADPRPLVLPCDPFSRPWTYTTDVWSQEISVPYYDPLRLDSRRLPRVNVRHPYLTMHDFLSPVLFKLPYQIDSEKFFTANGKAFLLPLTEQFFRFFKAEDLGNSVEISIEETNFDGITNVTLKIPVENGRITYKKRYARKSNAVISQNLVNDRDGVIVNLDFSLACTPFLTSNVVDITYNIGVVNISENGRELKVVPMHSDSIGQVIQSVNKIRSNQRDPGFARVTEHISFTSPFDLLRIDSHGYSGFLKPILTQTNPGQATYSFAIDFGTTNTHIEFKLGNTIHPFYYSEKDHQIVLLRNQRTDVRTQAELEMEDGESYLLQEMIPKAISANELINFPTRTVLLENGDVNYNARTVLFNDVNIGFEFEKKITRDYLAFRTELKWSNLNANRNRVRIQRYIEECMTLCKNLALKANANINETKIIWFYPLSMAGARLSQLQGIWEDAFKAVFPKCDLQNLIKQSESIAPFHYYSKKKGVMTQVAPAVSVDIGGGTTDVVVFSEGSPRVISSFKFGGNAIFGDGFNQSPPTNGYVSLFKDNYLRLLNENNLVNECRILGDILDNTDKSTDFVNYLFSLSSNQNVLKSGAPISFERDLALADDLKIVFIVFYGSMFYHIAQMMKSMALPQPVSIMFSGTGSKTLSLLSGSFSSAEKFASSIFNQVYKDESSQVIRFTTDPSPKELTSKGGLLAPVQDLNVGALVKSHLGGLSNLGMHSFLGVDGMERYAFSQISDSHFKDVVANIEHFGRILEEVDVKINFGHEFGVTPRSMETLRSLLKETGRLEEYVRLGFEMQRNDAGLDDQPLEETLFFYPMVGLLNDLAYKISNLKKENLWRD